MIVHSAFVDLTSLSCPQLSVPSPPASVGGNSQMGFFPLSFGFFPSVLPFFCVFAIFCRREAVPLTFHRVFVTPKRTFAVFFLLPVKRPLAPSEVGFTSRSPLAFRVSGPKARLLLVFPEFVFFHIAVAVGFITSVY